MRLFLQRKWHSFTQWCKTPWQTISFVRFFVLGLAVLVVVWLGLAFGLVHIIDDDPDYTPPEMAGPRTVAVLAGLLEREVNDHGWTANDPWFLPGWILDNKPSYQQGILRSISRMTIELRDSLARVRGSSTVDPNLERAAGLLQYPPDRWYFDFSASILPVARAESQYRQAAVRLRAYGEAVVADEAVYERRADNLRAAIERISADLGALVGQIYSQKPTFWLWDRDSDNLFYGAKGQVYAYGLLLAALREDFADVIDNHNLGNQWARTEESFQRGSALQVWVVIQGAPDSQLIPSHLMGMGFFLLQGRTQLKEIADILRN
ncbi:MAG: DUF2333 family protein [Pseudomonadota bacterium]